MQKSKDTRKDGLGTDLKNLSKTQKHNLFKDYLILYLSQDGHFIWNNETGASFGGTHNIRYGFTGSSDILGVAFNGLFIGVEVKTYSARQSKHQKVFEKNVRQRGGKYYVAHTNAETREQMDRDAKKQASAIQQDLQASKGIGSEKP